MWVDPLQQRRAIPHRLGQGRLLPFGKRSWQIEATLSAGSLSCRVDGVQLCKLGLLPVIRLERADQLCQFPHHHHRGDPSLVVALIHHKGAQAGGVVDRARVLPEESCLRCVLIPEAHQLRRRRGNARQVDSATKAAH